MGTQLSFPKKGTKPQFSAHVYCGQTAEWIKMPLGTEIDLGPGHSEMDGDPAPLHTKRGQSPQFLVYVYCGQTAEWIKIPVAIWYGGRPRPRRHCVRWGPSPPTKGAQQPPLFGPCLCGHGRPSQLLLSSCNDFPENRLNKFRAV